MIRYVARPIGHGRADPNGRHDNGGTTAVSRRSNGPRNSSPNAAEQLYRRIARDPSNHRSGRPILIHRWCEIATSLPLALVAGPCFPQRDRNHASIRLNYAYFRRDVKNRRNLTRGHARTLEHSRLTTVLSTTCVVRAGMSAFRRFMYASPCPAVSEQIDLSRRGGFCSVC